MTESEGFAYIYRTSDGAVRLPAGEVELGVVWSLDARRRRKPLSLKTFRGGHAVTKKIRTGSTLSLLKHSASKNPPRREIVFGHALAGTMIEQRTTKLLDAVDSLLEQMEDFGEDLATEYGIFMNTRDPVLRHVSPDLFTVVLPSKAIEVGKQFCWGTFYSGILFPDDPHPYSFWSNFGVLDRIKHDPENLVEVERSDIRSCEEKLRPINAGRIWFFHQNHDLNPLQKGLGRLRNLLMTSSDETVAVMSVPTGKAREQWESLGRTPEQRAMLKDPID